MMAVDGLREEEDSLTISKHKHTRVGDEHLTFSNKQKYYLFFLKRCIFIINHRRNSINGPVTVLISSQYQYTYLIHSIKAILTLNCIKRNLKLEKYNLKLT